MRKLRLIISVLEMLIGTALIVCSHFNIVDDFWSGFGVSVLIVGAIFLFKNIKYYANKTYRQEQDVLSQDERNKYISLKAWSWSGYLFVIIAAVGTIIFKVIGKEELMMLCSASICLVVIIYWVSYTILNKKY